MLIGVATRQYARSLEPLGANIRTGCKYVYSDGTGDGAHGAAPPARSAAKGSPRVPATGSGAVSPD